jgi:hypothetical protein
MDREAGERAEKERIEAERLEQERLRKQQLRDEEKAQKDAERERARLERDKSKKSKLFAEAPEDDDDDVRKQAEKVNTQITEKPLDVPPLNKVQSEVPMPRESPKKDTYSEMN